MRSIAFIGVVLVGFLPVYAFGQTNEFAPMALNSYFAVPRGLALAKVFRQDGALLGNVQRVNRGQDGHLEQILIGIPGPRVISLSAVDASYDEAANIVVTDEKATEGFLPGK